MQMRRRGNYILKGGTLVRLSSKLQRYETGKSSPVLCHSVASESKTMENKKRMSSSSLLGVQKKDKKLIIERKNKHNNKVKNKNKKKGFVKKVVDYLLSDSYMYAPMVSSSASLTSTQVDKSPSKGLSGYLQRATSRIPTIKLAKKTEQLREQPVEGSGKDHSINGIVRSEINGASISPFGRKETVERMVHYRTHILSSPEHGTDNIRFTTTKKPVINDFVTTRS